MKHRFFLLLPLLLCALLLWGCSYLANLSPTSPPPTEVTVPTTEAPRPNLIQQGEPWDTEGIFTELLISIPNVWSYTNAVGYGDFLLLYGYDTHLSDHRSVSLLLLDPLTGEVHGNSTFPSEGLCRPQIYGDRIYLADQDAGTIYELNDTLSITGQWKADPHDGFWYMGADQILYQFNEDRLEALDTATGESRILSDQNTGVSTINAVTPMVEMNFFHPDTGLSVPAVLDLDTGEILEPPITTSLRAVTYHKGVWLCTPTSGSSAYYLLQEQGRQRITIQEGYLNLLPTGDLLYQESDPLSLSLYTPEGTFLSGGILSEDPYYYLQSDLIWNESQKGYFLLVKGYEGDTHLLFWDLSKETWGSDLSTELLPEPSEAMAQLRTRADALEGEYGVDILIGEDCPTEFFDFRGEAITDWEEISAELDAIEIALGNYPAGFFRQLKFDGVQGIQICLIQNIEATDAERVGGIYNAFASQDSDRYTLVFDIPTTNEYTYYHEISHVIDRYLAWNVWEQEDALYSEVQWEALNPDGFQYAYSYGSDLSWFDYSYHTDWFIDSYAATYPTEDRARIMEYAMAEYNSYYFRQGTGLYEKLSYYARCIRDAFDTTGWPEVTTWEQYLTQ